MTGYPVSLNTRDNCGIISSTEGSWYVTSNCFLKQPFICEVDISEVNNIIPNPSLSEFQNLMLHRSKYYASLILSQHIWWER